MIPLLSPYREGRGRKGRRPSASRPAPELLEGRALLSSIGRIPAPRPMQGHALISPAKARDNTWPTVSITSLRTNSTIYTSPVSSARTLTASAGDTQSGIANVRFLLDGKRVIATAAAAPYS